MHSLYCRITLNSLTPLFTGETAASQLEALRNLPQMDELRNLVRANPEILPTLIQVHSCIVVLNVK